MSKILPTVYRKVFTTSRVEALPFGLNRTGSAIVVAVNRRLQLEGSCRSSVGPWKEIAVFSSSFFATAVLEPVVRSGLMKATASPSRKKDRNQHSAENRGPSLHLGGRRLRAAPPSDRSKAIIARRGQRCTLEESTRRSDSMPRKMVAGLFAMRLKNRLGLRRHTDSNCVASKPDAFNCDCLKVERRACMLEPV